MAELANVKTLFGQMRDRFRPGGLLWRLLSESVVGQRRKYIAAVVAMVLVAATTAGTAWIMGEIVDSMSQPGNRARATWPKRA